MAEQKSPEDTILSFIDNEADRKARKTVMEAYVKGRNILQKGYNYFNGDSLIDKIDDWTKRWNGYIPAQDPLLDSTQSQIFLNYTRNAVIGYLVKVALSVAKPKIIAVNTKLNIQSKQFAQFLRDANEYSLNAENGDSKFFANALETAVKGTCIVYEGYMRQEVDMEVPEKFDATTGKVKTKKQKRVLYDDCYQKIIAVEDFYIANAFEPDLQKQYWIIDRKITDYHEAHDEFEHYKNFQYVKPGAYTLTADEQTFYRGDLVLELKKDQVEILRYFCRSKNKHIVLINGVPIYNGVIPFKDGMYPYAKYIHEPLANDFFWGQGLPQKIMGEQDLKNMFFNMSVDKAQAALLPYGLTSDLDDLIEDEILAPNKIRKVGDINKWKFDTLPGLSQGDVQMLSLIDKEFQANSNNAMGTGISASPRGGKLAARQIQLQQQEMMQKLGFSTNYLEDGERDRTQLRLNHILQFYSIPKFEKITGKNGKEQEKLVYRDITLHNTKLSNGKIGNKIVKITDKMDKADRVKMADHLSVLEESGDQVGVPTEALAIDVSTFNDYNFDVQIIKNSTYERNQGLEQASRMEFAQWRLSIAQAAPVNAPELVKWVEEAYDGFDTSSFEGTPGPQQDKNASAGGNPPPEMGGQGNNPIPQGNRPASEAIRTNPANAIAKK